MTGLKAPTHSLQILPPPSSSVAVRHRPCLLNLRKRSRLSKPSAWRNLATSPTRSKRPMTKNCGTRPTSLEPLLAIVKRQKLAWFGQVTCHDSLSKTILQDTLEGERCCGRQRKRWMENIKEWIFLPMPELLTQASCRKYWKRIFAEWAVMSPHWSGDWTEQNWTTSLSGIGL